MIAARDIDQGELFELERVASWRDPRKPSYHFCICLSIFISIHICIFRRADLQRGSPCEGPQSHSHHAALPRVPQGKRELQEACSQVIMQRPASNLTQQTSCVQSYSIHKLFRRWRTVASATLAAGQCATRSALRGLTIRLSARWEWDMCKDKDGDICRQRQIQWQKCVRLSAKDRCKYN